MRNINLETDRFHSMHTTTWPDSTPKSLNNAFHIAPRAPAKPTRGQLDYKRKKTAARRTASVLRENKNQFTPTTQADRDRNAAIAGKSIYLGHTL